MISNPNYRDWTESELKVIESLRDNDFSNISKKEAREIWEKAGREFFPNFEDYWHEVTNPEKKTIRCENCRIYPCWHIQELFGEFPEAVICWIFHGSTCGNFKMRDEL